MNGSAPLELPGEANPLTEGILIHVLRNAASSNQQQIQTATKQLQVWETQEHYYVHLQSAFIDRRLPLEVRFIAITQLKNGIDKYWRKTANNAVTKEDREIIRPRLFSSGLDEGDVRLATANALVIAKVVRYDFPNAWPEVMIQIIQGLQAGASDDSNPIHLQNMLRITCRVVKELATGRLRATKASLQITAPHMLQVIGQIFADRLNRVTSSLSSSELEDWVVRKYLAESLFAIKIARRLVAAGYEFPHRASEVSEITSLIDQQFVGLLAICFQRPDLSLNSQVRQDFEKHLVQFGKFYVELSEIHPVSFVILDGQARLAQCWQLIQQFGQSFGSQVADFSEVGAYGDATEDDESAVTKVVLKALLTMRACLKLLTSPQQVLKIKKDANVDEEKRQARTLLETEVFTSEFAIECVKIIVQQYFVFRNNDLREWEEEPDEWEKREEAEGEDFETSIRACSEKLFLDLAINYKDTVVPLLIEAFRSAASHSNSDVLVKDSVYNAVGLASNVLRDQLDFDAFVTLVAVQDVQQTQPGCKLLRRRIAILLGQWISVKISDSSRPTVYEVFRFLLDSSLPANDQVVRVTAGRHLRNVADDWGFQPEPFLPYAPDIMSSLMNLIEEVDLPETKMTLLNTISVIVERLEHRITPYADRIVSLLPPLWEQSGDEHLMKQAILAILSRLFISMQAEGSRYHHLALPIISGAVKPGSDTQSYLLDDALDLWHAILTQTPDSAAGQGSDLASMTRYLIPILELGGDSLRKALEITESYILLMPSVMLQSAVATPLLERFAAMMDAVRAQVGGHIANVAELLVRGSDAVDNTQGIRTLTPVLLESGFLNAIVLGLKGSWVAHQTTGPKAIVNQIEGIVETDYFALIARLAFSSPELLVEALLMLPDATPPPALPKRDALDDLTARMTWLLDEWFSHVEDVSDSSRRKLMCLALTRMLTLHQPFILTRLQSLMNMWTSVITELTDGQGDTSADYLFISSQTITQDGAAGKDSWNGETIKTSEDVRRTQLDGLDPVQGVNIVALVRETLISCVQQCGGEAAFQKEWLVNVDKDIVTAFEQLGIL